MEGGIKYTSTIELSDEAMTTTFNSDRFKIPALIKDKKSMLYKTMDEFNVAGKGDGLPRKTLLKESTRNIS